MPGSSLASGLLIRLEAKVNRLFQRFLKILMISMKVFSIIEATQDAPFPLVVWSSNWGLRNATLTCLIWRMGPLASVLASELRPWVAKTLVGVRELWEPSEDSFSVVFILREPFVVAYVSAPEARDLSKFDVTPLNAFPSPPMTEWVMKMAIELSKKMGISFAGIEYKVDLFREIEKGDV